MEGRYNMTVRTELEYYELRKLQQLAEDEENRLCNQAYENNGSTATHNALKSEARKYRKLAQRLKNTANEHIRCADNDITYAADEKWHNYLATVI